MPECSGIMEASDDFSDITSCPAPEIMISFESVQILQLYPAIMHVRAKKNKVKYLAGLRKPGKEGSCKT